MTLDPSLFEEAAKAIDSADSLALACHVGPDGDALGSMLALAEAAARHGKEVTASFGSPYVLPDNLSFLPTGHLVAPGEFPNAPELMVVLDVGSLDRLGELAKPAQEADKVIVIDHHVTNEGFGDIALIDPKSAATGELVFQLFGTLGWDVTPEEAQSLHTALVTDTGRFTYSNTTPHTLQVASELVALGAVPSEIGRHVYEEAPFGYLKAAGVAMGRAELDEELRVVSTVITEEELEANDIDWGDTDNLIDLLRLAKEADTAVLIKGFSDGRVKGSLRSRGDTDVGALAASLGGGGHKLAAGFTVEGDVDAVRKQVISLVEDFR